jgi:hypothetical protein
MAGLLDSVMQPGPTIAADRERRASKGSRGLLAALGGPMAYAPNPVVSALGNALLGAQYVTGEADPYEGARSLSDMTAMAVGSRLPAPLRNIITYHGSPHKFDKFDSSKIGTGEGNQAYSHGLYFAEAKDVAQSYKDALSKENIVALGRVFGPDDLKKLPDAQRAAMSAGSVQGIEGNLKRAKEMLAEGADSAWVNDFVRYTNELAKSPLHRQTEGYLYKTDVPDSMVAKMLDWDKPLSQQAPEVQKALRKIGSPILQEMLQPMELGNTYGSAVINALKRERFTGRDGVEPLQKAGIPGIRYLDGGSRGAGQGTRNYVVFPGEEGLLSILERNGQSLR